MLSLTASVLAWLSVGLSTLELSNPGLCTPKGRHPNLRAEPFFPQGLCPPALHISPSGCAGVHGAMSTLELHLPSELRAGAAPLYGSQGPWQ